MLDIDVHLSDDLLLDCHLRASEGFTRLHDLPGDQPHITQPKASDAPRNSPSKR